MKALVLKDKHRAAEMVEVPKPVAGPGEAMVRVEAAALNHRDVWIQKGQYAGLKYPIVPVRMGRVLWLKPRMGRIGSGDR